ncbi:hypothetical protein pEaSNUABM37_00084 [Erwinia phage pEa_SNUABM_37]|nr:hypothetical protein pEaSNUABM37_00084 [Erwinia phage pEa_SNUABM_37]QXO10554.1 hypothetical protein pEaSNUABM48_00084 [Erwinia phage pEa_SNUABM_48]
MKPLMVMLLIFFVTGCEKDDEYRRLESGYRLEMLSCWKANVGNEGMCNEKYNDQVKKLKERLNAEA